MMRFYKMGNYSYDDKRFLRIQRQSRELIIPLASNDTSFIMQDFFAPPCGCATHQKSVL